MKEKRTFPSPFIFLAVALIITVFLVGVFFTRGESEMSDVEVLPVRSFTDRPTNFIGNRYQLDGLILEQLVRDPEVGRLFNLQVDDSKVRIPLLVPSDIVSNVDIQQRYKIRLMVDDGGLLIAEKLIKL